MFGRGKGTEQLNQQGENRVDSKDILRFLAQKAPWLIPLTLILACNPVQATETPIITPTALPTETATAVPTKTKSPTALPTETATAVPTETATPEVLGQIFVLAESAGGPEIYVTPEGGGTSDVGKNAEFASTVSKKGGEVLEMLKGFVKEKTEKFFLFFGSSIDESNPEKMLVTNSYTLLRGDGSVESVVTQSFAVTVGMVEGSDFPAITAFEVGDQSVKKEFTSEYIEELRVKAEKKLGITIDKDAFHVGVRFTDGVVVVGVEASDTQTQAVPLARPVEGSISGSSFTDREKGASLDAATVIELSDLLKEEIVQTPVEDVHITAEEMKAFYGGRFDLDWTLSSGKEIKGSPLSFDGTSSQVIISKENGQEVEVKHAMLTGKVGEVIYYPPDQPEKVGFGMTLIVEYAGKQITIPFTGINMSEQVVYLVNPNTGVPIAYPVHEITWKEIVEKGLLKQGDLIGVEVAVPVDGAQSTFPFHQHFLETMDIFLSGGEVAPEMTYPDSKGNMLAMPGGFFIPELVQKYPSPQ